MMALDVLNSCWSGQQNTDKIFGVNYSDGDRDENDFAMILEQSSDMSILLIEANNSNGVEEPVAEGAEVGEEPSEEPEKKAEGPKRVKAGAMFAKYIQSPSSVRTKCDEMLNSQMPDDIDRTCDLPRSVVFVSKANQLYRLEFNAIDTIMFPLYIRSRSCTPTDNEKQVQPMCQAYQVVKRGDISKTQNVMVSKQKFALRDDTDVPIHTPVRVYTEGPRRPKQRARISEGAKEQPNGVIFCKYKGILIRVMCPTLPICKTRSPASDAVLHKMKQLRMPSSESRKNKGQLVIRYGNDLISLSFDMEDISLQSTEKSISAAVQTEDRMVYIRERSAITGRTFLLALPESTYYYQDPMQSIHRLHMSFMGTNIMPLWKYEVMRSRIDVVRNGADTIEAEIDKAFSRTRGSRLFFEAQDSLLTIESGMLCGDIDSGQEVYARMMCERDSVKPNRSGTRTDRATLSSTTDKEESSENVEETEQAS